MSRGGTPDISRRWHRQYAAGHVHTEGRAQPRCPCRTAGKHDGRLPNRFERGSAIAQFHRVPADHVVEVIDSRRTTGTGPPMRKRADVAWCIGLTVLAALLRVSALSPPSLWRDDAWQSLVVRVDRWDDIAR